MLQVLRCGLGKRQPRAHTAGVVPWAALSFRVSIPTEPHHPRTTSNGRNEQSKDGSGLNVEETRIHTHFTTESHSTFKMIQNLKRQQCHISGCPAMNLIS